VDISGYIRELLSGHDCVIIPEFGAFIGNYASARLDSATNTFYPPSKKISFNVNLTHNDGLLIGRISSKSGLNYSDARDLVEEFVKETRKKISHGERVTFSDIGSFTCTMRVIFSSNLMSMLIIFLIHMDLILSSSTRLKNMMFAKRY
jgi:hypothetical protein